MIVISLLPNEAADFAHWCDVNGIPIEPNQPRECTTSLDWIWRHEFTFTTLPEEVETFMRLTWE